jgi:D-alanyl-D-alanine dipeptidase
MFAAPAPPAAVPLARSNKRSLEAEPTALSSVRLIPLTRLLPVCSLAPPMAGSLKNDFNKLTSGSGVPALSDLYRPMQLRSIPYGEVHEVDPAWLALVQAPCNMYKRKREPEATSFTAEDYVDLPLAK